MRTFFQKLIITTIGLSIALNPLVVLVPQTVKAEDLSDGGSLEYPTSAIITISLAQQKALNTDSVISEPSATCPAKIATNSQAYNDLSAMYAKYSPNGSDSAVTFADIFTDPNDPQIVMNLADRETVNALSCLAAVMPNYSENLTALFSALPSRLPADSTDVAADGTLLDQATIIDLVNTEKNSASPRFYSNEQYFDYLRYGSAGLDSTVFLANSAKFDSYVKEAKKSYSNNDIISEWNTQLNLILNGQTPTVDVPTLTCVTGMDANTLRAYITDNNVNKRDYVANVIKTALNSLTLDIRVVNLLIYLVTPKDQGGAGHWRIRVARLFQSDAESNESIAINQANANINVPTLVDASANNGSNKINCDSTMTAAECGSQANQSDVTVSDTDGTEYEAFFRDMNESLSDETNISAHNTGQAVDISEVDDLRCTLVKKRRIGKWSSIAQPVRPIKLVWQTTDGWNASNGASDFDTMSMMKDLAKQSIVDMLGSMNSDISDYSGDLTKANFGDLVGILGQSLLTGVMSSPGTTLEGYSVSDTVKNLGMVYFADYFGLPREIFQGADITDMENIKYIIGRSAIEKKLGLPYGSLDSLNLNATNLNGLNKPVYDLEGLLVNIGLRKVEHEMGLDRNDLDRYLQGDTVDYGINNTSLGRIVIEDDLSLPKNSWPTTPETFGDLKNFISSARVSILKIDPGYIDNILHIDAETTKKFMSGSINSEQYAEIVGTSRFNDTTAGLAYFRANNSAYQLPGPIYDEDGKVTDATKNMPDTWTEAINGKVSALKTIGIYTLARLLGENSLDINTTDILPYGSTFKSAIISSADGSESEIEFDRTTYGQFVFRNWLEQNLTTRLKAAEGCGKPGTDNAAVNIVYNGQPTYNGPASIKNPTQEDAQNTVNSVCLLYSDVTINNIKYVDSKGIPRENNTSSVVHQTVSEESAISAGLINSDLYSIMGYGQANGRAVFERIGSKMLYYGIAKKAMTPEEKTAIDLSDTNPSIDLPESNLITFYWSRIDKIQRLVSKIQTEWAAFSSTDAEAKDITTRVDNIINATKKIYAENGFDLTNIREVATTAITIKTELAEIKNDLGILKDRYAGQKGTEAINRVNQINTMIYDVNELILVASEIMVGHSIDSTDAITIEKLNQATARNKNSSVSGNGLSAWEIMLLVFGLMSNTITPKDFFLRLGANSAESKLGLPRNSLLYLISNYDQFGVTGIDTFYQSLGQAQIEAEFSMPTYYFQGNVIRNTMPDFYKKDDKTGYADLKKYAVDEDGDSIILPAYTQYVFSHSVLSQGLQVSGDTKVSKPATTLSIDDWITSVRMMHGRYKDNFINWVKTAQKGWLAKNKSIERYENTISDVVANIQARGFAGGIQSAQNDLLMRLGFPTGNFEALVDDSPLAWQVSNTRAGAIDKQLKLPSGYTKMLFTGNNSITSKSISQKDKNLIAASTLNISQNELEKYIQIVNGEVLPSENAEYGPEFQTDYVVDNPYADPGITGTTCPVSYTEKEGFVVNETTIPSNSFCYYDKKGRHCFQSTEEATHYSANHDEDRITNVVENISTNIALSLNLDSPRLIGEVYQGLLAFINNKSAVTIFNDQILIDFGHVEVEDNTTRAEITKNLFDTYSEGKLTDALMSLFTRESVASPLFNYKVKVGTWVAQAVLTTKLFNSLGLNIDPTLFDGADFYDILTGDYSSLTRIGSTLVDRALQIKPGTTLLIINAVSPEGRRCALQSAGGGLLGSVFGLNSFPINKLNLNAGDFLSTLGQEKIEETLSLPRGTFRVDDPGKPETDNLDNLVKNVGIINFFAAFKLPIDVTNASNKATFDNAVRDILGDERYGRVSGSSPQYKIAQVKLFLSASLTVTGTSNEGVKTLEQLLNTLLHQSGGLYQTLASTDASSAMPSKPITSDLSNDVSNSYASYNQQVRVFYDQASSLDNTLGLPKFSTFLLLAGQTKPSKYISEVGTKLGVKVGEMELAKLLGMDEIEATSAITIGEHLTNFFSCNGPGEHMVDKECVVGGGFYKTSADGSTTLVREQSPYYHQWGTLFENLDQIFDFNLDRFAGFEVGTFSYILDNPNQTIPVLLQIGAEKLDAKIGLKSKNDDGSINIVSLSGLYQFMTVDEYSSDVTTCRAKVYPNNEDLDLDNRIAAAVKEVKNKKVDISNPKVSDDDVMKMLEAELDLELLQQDADKLMADERACIEESRISSPNYQDRFKNWTELAGATEIHRLVSDINIPGCVPGPTNNYSCNIGVDMPVEDIQKVFHGDLRYLEAVGMAVSANFVFIEIGNIGTRNCNEAEKNGGCSQAVPEEMRISYEEIKAALFGIPDDQAIALATWNEENTLAGIDYKPNPDTTSTVATVNCDITSDVLLSGIANCVAGAGKKNDALLTIDENLDFQYGYSPANITTEQTRLDTEYTGFQSNLSMANSILSHCDTSDDPDTCVKDARGSIDSITMSISENRHKSNLLNSINHPDSPDAIQLDKNSPAVIDVQKSAKKAAQDKIKYDLMDITLWKLDENIFPGFSQIMFTGNATERWAALAQYTRAGLTNGHLFGINFKSVDPLLVNAVAGGVAYLTAGTDEARQNALKNFGDAEFSTLTNFLSSHSEKWLGFKLDRNMSEGLLTSIFTGDWGGNALTLDGVLGEGNTTTPFLGSDHLTLGGAVQNFGLSKIFGWADRQLGLTPGQTMELFSATKKLYQASKAFQAAKSTLAAAQGADGDPETIAKFTAEKQAAYESMRAAAGALVQIGISIMVDKLLGKTLGSIEEQLGLVPGSLAPLVSTAIYAGVVAAANAGVFGSAAVGFLPALGPWGIAAVLIMFALTNLLSVYRVEYWCSADGYYPRLGTADPNKNDVSGLDVMGGRVDGNLNTTIQRLSVLAAQYKAQRLIGDTLNIQYNSDFNDSEGLPTIPTQMMTGRTEDVDYWKESVQNNMCLQRFGDGIKMLFNGQSAVCDIGMQRMGLWQNPQTTAWTHIGF